MHHYSKQAGSHKIKCLLRDLNHLCMLCAPWSQQSYFFATSGTKSRVITSVLAFTNVTKLGESESEEQTGGRAILIDIVPKNTPF